MARVLILESDRVLAHNISYFLRQRGHKVSWAAGPQTAIEEADKEQPDAIVMDLILGGHGGVEFLFELRSYPEWQQLPIIIYSSMPERELTAYQAELAQLKITTHLYKPESTLADVADCVDLAVLAKV